MANLARAIPGLLKREGGLVNDPRDPGGLTNYGITQRDFPNEDIRNLTPERATEIYRVEYWTPLHCREMPSQVVAEMVFDHGVNAGISRAAKILQRLIGAYPDGRIGPNTLRKLRREIEDAGSETLARKYTLKRIEYYTDLAWIKDRPLSHLVSWIRRALELAP